MGPRLKDVEDRGNPTRKTDRAPRFNGATSQGRGRRGRVCGRRTSGHASMGPRLKDVEDDSTSSGKVFRPYWLQWGHVSRTWKTP